MIDSFLFISNVQRIPQARTALVLKHAAARASLPDKPSGAIVKSLLLLAAS
jgi:hypothetical protein